MAKLIEISDSKSRPSDPESSNRRTLELPTELWIPILHEVGTPHRADLRALPFVCRRLYHLSIPLLYEYIIQSSWIPRWFFPSLTTNPHLQHTTRFEANVEQAHSYSSLSTILSAMKNLQRLSLKLPSFRRFPLASINPTLTHFVLISDCPEEALCSFLSAQPFLEFLELIIPAPSVDLAENTLMNLKTFIGTRELLASIAPGRQIEHFDDRWSYTNYLPDAASCHLRSIRTNLCICPIMELLDNIEYLNFTARSMEEVRIVSDLHKHDYSPPPQLDSFLDRCRSIPSDNLRYISIGSREPVSLPCARTLFNLFPRLEAVDYITSMDHVRHFHRYTPNCDVETRVVVPERRLWDHWWTDLRL
ncbi:hypothetical protein ONZ45_g19216 [Pleurotus djamor]|nr:hypothetical protein ONZ45_g19216 [Pleurotus djamor]